MSAIALMIPQFKKMLGNLDQWLSATVAFAEKKSFDPNTLLSARLAPDQFALVRQVQAACDTAKFAAAHLAGQVAPKHPDTEQTLDELHARIQTCIAYLDTFSPADFAGAEERPVKVSYLPGKVISGSDYWSELALPNFYFHLTTAYSILRHNGMDLGKRDFLGPLSLRDEPS